MSRYTTKDVKSFSIFFLNNKKLLKPDTYTSNSCIIWSIDSKETGRISYQISTYRDDSHITLDYKTRTSDIEEWIPIKYKIKLHPLKCYIKMINIVVGEWRFCIRRGTILDVGTVQILLTSPVTKISAIVLGHLEFFLKDSKLMKCLAQYVIHITQENQHENISVI